MGQRYRFSYSESGDVLDPSQWIEDNNELASEFNGYLDRDNIGEATIEQNEIAANTFTDVSFSGSTTTYRPDKTSIGWQGGAGNNANGIYNTTETCEVDCLLVVELTLTATWDNGTNTSITGSGSTAAPYALSTFTTDTVQVRVVVDGVEVARSGLFDPIHKSFGLYLVGAIPVTSGDHEVYVECAMNRRRWEGLAQEGSCTYDIDFNERGVLITQEKR